MSAIERTACALSLDELFELLGKARFALTTEALTQAEMELYLRAVLAENEVSREHRLSAADRPDFLIDGRFVIEVKGPRHGARDVRRQLERYATHPQVEAIILATSRAMSMGGSVGGKPVRVLNLGRAWL